MDVVNSVDTSVNLEDLLTESEIKGNITNSPYKEDEILGSSAFNKGGRRGNNTNKPDGNANFAIDELDTLDLEIDDISRIDLQELNNKNNETIPSSFQPKKKFTFFNDAPML
jgi:hypothetical protein